MFEVTHIEILTEYNAINHDFKKTTKICLHSLKDVGYVHRKPHIIHIPMVSLGVDQTANYQRFLEMQIT